MSTIIGQKAADRQTVLSAANEYRAALYAMDEGLSEKFKREGVADIGGANAAISAMASLLGAYGGGLEQHGVLPEVFEESLLELIRENMAHLRNIRKQ